MSRPKPLRVLIIDDDELIIESMRARLEAEGFEAIGALDGREGVDCFREGVDAVLLDLALPDIGGEEVFRRLRTVDPTVPVIMMTGHSTVSNAVDMMKAGLFHYAEKRADYMSSVIEQVREATAQRARMDRAPRLPRVDDLVGSSSELRRLRKELTDSAASDGPVLIVGERGTGKRLVAEILHAGSPRRAAPLLSYDCAGAPSAKLEAELFGLEPPAGGATEGYPGALELANGGTVLLGQVSELPAALQSKLLDYLETGRFFRRGGVRARTSDARIIATSATNLRKEVSDHNYSNPLRLALGGHRPLEVPALRERPEDVPDLARHFLAQFSADLARPLEGFSPEAEQSLQRQPWPGNILELKNLVERAVLLASEQKTLDENDLQNLAAHPSSQDFVLPRDGVQLETLERSLVLQALNRTDHNRTQAGKLLGLNRDQVRYRIKKFDLKEGDEDEATAVADSDRPRT